MRRSEIAQQFDEIVAFAEVERFLDTPVKLYSSGMYVRLAFAVAAHLEPEILLVDEVLAVGDAAFQQKCLGKMSDVARHGRTILFVSHNMIAMEGLCDRVIWMREGRVAEDGPARAVVSSYLRTFATTRTEQQWSDPASAPGNEQIRMHAVRVRPEGGNAGDEITLSTPFVIEFEYWRTDASARFVPTVHLFNEQGTHRIQRRAARAVTLAGASGWADAHSRCLSRAGRSSEQRPPPRLLRAGEGTRYCLLAARCGGIRRAR